MNRCNFFSLPVGEHSQVAVTVHPAGRLVPSTCAPPNMHPARFQGPQGSYHAPVEQP